MDFKAKLLFSYHFSCLKDFVTYFPRALRFGWEMESFAVSWFHKVAQLLQVEGLPCYLDHVDAAICYASLHFPEVTRKNTETKHRNKTVCRLHSYFFNKTVLDSRAFFY